MSLRLNFSKPNVTNIRGLPMSGFEVWFDVTSGDLPVAVVSTDCSVIFELKSGKHEELHAQQLSQLFFRSPVVDKNQRCSAIVRVPLGFETLKQIEQRRDGRDGAVCLRFIMHVNGSELVPLSDGSRVLGVPQIVSVRYEEQDIGQNPIEIPRDDWLKHLKAMGFAEVEVFELSGYKDPCLPGLAVALSELRAAEKSMRLGNWPDVMARTRRALECAASVSGNTKNTAEGFKAFWLKAFPNDSEKELRDALDSIVKSLDDLQNLERHKKVPFPDIQRPEALLVLRQTLALFEYLGERMRGA